MEKSNEKEMTLIGHLKELRKRLIRCFFLTLMVFFFCYFFREDLLFLIKKPLNIPLQKYSNQQKESSKPILENLLDCSCQQQKTNLSKQDTESILLDCRCQKEVSKKEAKPLVFIGLPEIFFTELKISFFLALFFSFPYWIIEIWFFVMPALYRKEKTIFWLFVPATLFFFLGGAVFGYFVVFPLGFDFFLSLTKPQEIVPSLSVGQYVSFAIKLLFAFGLVFEFPLVVLFLARLGLITPQFMLKNAKYAIVFIFIFAAILTPPDPFTMLLMAIPLIILYIISILLCYLTFNRKLAKLKIENL